MNVSYNAKRGAVGNFKSHKPTKQFPSSVFDDDIEDELGTETEAEKHMKLLLQKQLNTNLSITEQFKQHKSFTCPSTYTPLTELVKGSCSLEKFKETEKYEENTQQLQQCGLSEEEIHLYLAFKNGKDQRNLIEPAIWRHKIEGITEKINAHFEELEKPQFFNGVKQLSRHEMDIEKSLYAGCADKNVLLPLVSVRDDETKCDDPIFSHIKELSQKISSQSKKGIKRKNSFGVIKPSEVENDMENDRKPFEFDPNIHHVVVPLGEDEVLQNQLSLEEIRKLPRFENYDAGEPSRVLYLQNLHTKVNVQELQALFNRFEEKNRSPLEYRVMKGKMRGQAFIKFSDTKVAEEALNFSAGYILREKPIIIKFGKQR